MRKELIDLYNGLEDSIPKYKMSNSSYVTTKDDVSEECAKLFDHLKKMNTVTVRTNSFGIDVIVDTSIRVFKSIAHGAYIESRYGKLVVPTKVDFY